MQKPAVLVGSATPIDTPIPKIAANLDGLLGIKDSDLEDRNRKTSIHTQTQ
jgi:hypothetical protein